MPLNMLEKLWTRGKAFLGVEFPILGGAMSWISESTLVSAISNAGGFGVIAAGNMPPELLQKEIEDTVYQYIVHLKMRTEKGTLSPNSVNTMICPIQKIIWTRQNST